MFKRPFEICKIKNVKYLNLNQVKVEKKRKERKGKERIEGKRIEEMLESKEENSIVEMELDEEEDNEGLRRKTREEKANNGNDKALHTPNDREKKKRNIEKAPGSNKQASSAIKPDNMKIISDKEEK